jgi:hypothetical protein
MKRAEALHPLSREHLRALLAAKKVGEATDPEEAGRSFLEFWREDGQQHFRTEEEVLLPVWALHAPVDRAAVARMLEEHLAIRRDALRFEAGEVSLEELPEIATRLHDHVRFEERELFPKIEDSLGPELIGRLADALE